jgi:hypothetical protein
MKKKRHSTKAPPRAAKKRAAVARVSANMVEAPVPYLEVRIRERVTEVSMVGVFEQVRDEVLRHQPKRVLVDMREASVVLTISDMNGLAKMVAGVFAGVIEKLTMLMRPQDVLSEKFFEPSVNRRGLPTLVTTDPDEAIYWLMAKLKPAR